MAKKPQSGAEVAKALLNKMLHKEAAGGVERRSLDTARTSACATADGPTLEDRMDAVVAAAPAAAAAPKRMRMSGADLWAMQRQERREKRLKERGY